MNTTRSPQDHTLTWICPTAGHIIDDLAREMLVVQHNTTQSTSLPVAPTSIRIDGRPLHSINDPSSFRDDCAFLIVNKEDLHRFQRSIPNANPFYMNAHLRQSVDLSDPLSASRFRHFNQMVQSNPPMVYKHGSSTQFTCGRFTGMTQRAPRGWYDDGDRNDAEIDAEIDVDRNEWMGIVQWVAGIPFSSPGDSGSLVFAMVDGIHIPLGIHVGSPEHGEHSYFISIETFCFTAEAEGWEVRFAS